MKFVEFFGLSLLSGSLDEVADDLSNTFQSNSSKARVVCHINANNFEQIVRRECLMDSPQANATMFVDGIGVKCALAFLGKGWVPDINGTDLFPIVMARLGGAGISAFLLGGTEEVVRRAAAMIRERWQVRITGFRSGYFPESQEREICTAVNESGAQILIVGRGCPLQEEFALRNRSLLKVRLIWTVGGLFDFIAGRHRRAPLVWRRLRMEWLFRWILEPRAKARRTWILYPRFAARVLRQCIPVHPRRVQMPTHETDNSLRSFPAFNILSTKAPVKAEATDVSFQTKARTALTEALSRAYSAPPYLILFVSDRCWMHCSHCWFSEDWKAAHHTRPLLTFDQLNRLADSCRLHFVSFTGGEAFRRDDIVELITMMRCKSRITRYQIPTSGYMPEMIEQKARQLLERNPGTPFRVDVSLDGTAVIHDQIRRVKGGWDSAVETIKRLNALKSKYAHFDVGVITTVSHRNQEQVDEIASSVRSFHPGEWMINIARGTVRDPKAIDVDVANYRRAANLADKGLSAGQSRGHRGGIMGPLLSAKNTVRRRIIADTIEGRRAGGGCAAGSLGGVIYADGAVHACELIDDELGNLHDYDYDLKAIWHGAAAKELRRRIQESRCQCTQECFLSVSMLIQPTALAGMTGELVKRGATSISRALQLS